MFVLLFICWIPLVKHSTAPFHLLATARDPEPGHLVQDYHSLQALGQGVLLKPGQDLTGQEGPLGLENVDTETVFDQCDDTGAANDWVPGIQHSGGPGHDGAGAAFPVDLLLASVAGKEQREDVVHGAGLGEEYDEHFDSTAERCQFNFSIRCTFPATNNYFHKAVF